MRLALLSDVHGNLEALTSVLEDLDRHAPDAALVCAGDVVGYGPDPGACLDILGERGARVVMGNHEQMVLGIRGFDACIRAGITAALWTRHRLLERHWRVLRSLPRVLEPANGVVICHGDLEDAGTYVSTRERAEVALRQLQSFAPHARVLVCGHTHRALCYTRREGFFEVSPGATLDVARFDGCIVNPGSVGQARDGGSLARYAVLDLENMGLSSFAVAYDHDRTFAKMRCHGLLVPDFRSPPTGLARRIEQWKTEWTRLGARLAR